MTFVARRASSDAVFDSARLGLVESPRLADQIAERIRELILSEDIQEGTRLPSERVLAERFGTSRPTVSQAVRTLSLMGLVESRRGSGAYVIRQPIERSEGGTGLLMATATNLNQLLELRLWLEGLGVREAILGGESDVANARAALHRLAASVGETSTWIAADTLFHATVVGLAGNPILTRLYEQTHQSLLEYQYRAWVDRELKPAWLAPESADEHIALHAPIVDALEARDLVGAADAVQRHHDAMHHHLLNSSRLD